MHSAACQRCSRNLKIGWRVVGCASEQPLAQFLVDDDCVLQFLLGVLSTIAALMVGALLDPVREQFARMGRIISRQTGVQMHVELDPAVIWAGMPPWRSTSYFLPGGEPIDLTPPDQDDMRAWVYRHGGCDAVESVVRVTLVGATSATVVLETPQVSATEDPLPAGHQITFLAGGASLSPRSFDVNLNYFGVHNPIVSFQDEGSPLPTPTVSFTLKSNEAEQFLIRITCEAHSLIYWRARIPILIDGHRRFLDVDDFGSPIKFAGGSWSGGNLVWNGTQWEVER